MMLLLTRPGRTCVSDFRPLSAAGLCRMIRDADSETAMFEPKENPGYQILVRDATHMITKWMQNDWYESSTDRIGA